MLTVFRGFGGRGLRLEELSDGLKLKEEVWETGLYTFLPLGSVSSKERQSHIEYGVDGLQSRVKKRLD